MKKYLVFKYRDFYPSGGWCDFVSDFDLLEDAMRAETVIGYESIQIVDRDTKEVIFFGDPSKA